MRFVEILVGEMEIDDLQLDEFDSFFSNRMFMIPGEYDYKPMMHEQPFIPGKILYKESLEEISPSFEYWELLPNEIKCMIIKEVDFVTRLSLSLCSNNMNQLSKQIPIRIEQCTATCENGEHSIDFKSDSSGGIYVTSDEEEVLIECRMNGSTTTWGRHQCLENEPDVFRYAEKIFKLGKYQVDHLNCNIGGFGECGESDMAVLEKLQVMRKLTVHTGEVKVLERVLNIAKLPLEKLEIRFDCDIDYELINETIKNARFLYVHGFPFNYLSMLNLNCEKIYFGPEVITDWAINFFMKIWVNGNGSDNFRKATFCVKQSDAILNGLAYVECDDEFRIENPTLRNMIDNKYHNKYYYIESKNRSNGALLIMNSFKVEFLVTGKSETSFMVK